MEYFAIYKKAVYVPLNCLHI